MKMELKISLSKRHRRHSMMNKLRNCQNTLFSSPIVLNSSPKLRNCSTSHGLQIKKAVIYSKLTRYEYEKKLRRNLTDGQLLAHLRKRGTDTTMLMHFHKLQKDFESQVVKSMRETGIDVKILNKFGCADENIEKSDIVVTVGGDGTFLLAARMIFDNKKPIIGFNSDPNRSEGHLCLSQKYSTNVKEVFHKLQYGYFDWLMRSRIRTTLIAEKDTKIEPHFLHYSSEEMTKECLKLITNNGNQKVLPFLALNEVFTSEKLAAKASHLGIRLNESQTFTNLKCSGICVSTGTGSTSWHLNMNRIPVQTVSELLMLVNVDVNESFAQFVSDVYNQNLIFPPHSNLMGYTIKDMISTVVWPDPKGIKPRGFASSVDIKSNCYNGFLVIDGGVAYEFNDGAVAILEILPEFALRTVVIKD